MSTDPLPSPDPEAVRAAFLTDKPSKKEQPAEVKPIDLAEEARAALNIRNTNEPEEVEKRVDTPLDPTFDMQGPTEMNFMAWAMKAADVGEVKVEDSEKALFLKGVMNDTEVTFPVTIPLSDEQLTIHCKTLSVAAMDLMFATLGQDEEDKRIKDPAQYATTMQKYAVCMQVVKINGTPVEPFNPESVTSCKDGIEALRDHAYSLSLKTNHARWHYLLIALRIFTIKIKLCSDAALNQDFWLPAGTD
jgi:hypothetical protein